MSELSKDLESKINTYENLVSMAVNIADIWDVAHTSEIVNFHFYCSSFSHKLKNWLQFTLYTQLGAPCEYADTDILNNETIRAWWEKNQWEPDYIKQP